MQSNGRNQNLDGLMSCKLASDSLQHGRWSGTCIQTGGLAPLTPVFDILHMNIKTTFSQADKDHSLVSPAKTRKQEVMSFRACNWPNSSTVSKVFALGHASDHKTWCGFTYGCKGRNDKLNDTEQNVVYRCRRIRLTGYDKHSQNSLSLGPNRWSKLAEGLK